jgi:hypothetical protein
MRNQGSKTEHFIVSVTESSLIFLQKQNVGDPEKINSLTITTSLANDVTTSARRTTSVRLIAAIGDEVISLIFQQSILAEVGF